MHHLTRLLVNRASFALGLVLLLLGGLAIVGWGQATRDAQVDDTLPRDVDSTRAALLLEELPQADGSTALVLVTREDDGELGEGGLAEATSAVQGLDVPDVGAPAGPPLLPSDDGTAAISVLPVTASSSSANAEAVTTLREQLDDALPEGLVAQVTGPAGIEADLAAVFEGADVRLLGVTASVVAILLVVTYRSPVLWLVPLLVVAVADRTAVTVATRVLERVGVPWDESTTGILSVLVFGAGTNYALLLISRYRDELRLQEDRYEAMRLALGRASEAVVASAVTVFVGTMCLALSLVPTTRGLGIACAVGVLVAMAFVLLALPGLLVSLGRWVFWPRVPRAGGSASEQTRSIWRRVGDTVARRPATWAGVVLAGLAVLAVGLVPTRLGLPTAEQFLEQPEAIAASERLAESFPAGSNQPASVLTRDADGASQALDGLDGVAEVREGARDDDWAQLQVVLADDPDSEAAAATVERMRAALDDAGLGSDDAGWYVGGATAESVDLADASARDRLVIFPLVFALVLGALVLLLRSLVAPVLLVLTVLGTYVAALGASWWIFTEIFGFSALDQSVPLLSFLFLVALGVDYNIFLVTRTREEAVHHGPREGMLRALAATGGVITSAGILLAAVFAVLGVLPLVVLAQVGTVICLGVLLDTLVVRTVLVPALALRLGPAFWWPRTVTAEDDAREPALTPR